MPAYYTTDAASRVTATMTATTAPASIRALREAPARGTTQQQADIVARPEHDHLDHQDVIAVRRRGVTIARWGGR
ncbi:hypothetical protein H4W31_004846 [Plantactinospora soyae]|uniref:Uncharacterized protein n=1 Tax=Plantactinospora soyae TaxID=1544732 RepID=A0A927R107_9ACTN|nr:hypothetical protein [Plantactinospora soyae]